MSTDILRPGDTVLVTGGAGYVGSHLVRMLLDRGLHVRVLDTFLYGTSGLEDCMSTPGLDLHRGDICNIRDMIRVSKGVKAVVALAALVGDGACELDHDETVAINIESTKLLCQVVNMHPEIERVVFASSCSVYGATEDLVLNEGSRLTPVSFYARSRILSEGILSRELEGRSVVTLRLGTVCGSSPRMRLDLMINTMTVRAVTDGKITVMGGEAWRPHVHVCDVAAAFVLAAQTPHEKVGGEIFNVGADHNNMTISETAVMVAQEIGGVDIEYADTTDDPRSYRVSFDKIKHVLGFVPRHSLVEAVREVRDLLNSGAVDPNEERYSNLKYLQVHGFLGDRDLPVGAGIRSGDRSVA
ncbi:MAG: SDR family oxidoreductase [Deltaproteobacteria bacterium]